MNVDGMDAEELKVFLQEAEEQIQLLDENIVRLEKEADNTDLLQDIFRAAHTLKGSSGMLGFETMAALTHAMEDALDKLRSGSLVVSPELVDALLESLDALKLMKESLASGGEAEVDIAVMVGALRDVVKPAGAVAAAEETKVSLYAAVAADPAATERLEGASSNGLNLHHVRITIEQESDWAAVRCLQVVNELSGLGEVICSVPSREEIEQEKVGHELQVLLATEESADVARGAASAIDDLQLVEVQPWSAEGAEPADERGAAQYRDDDQVEALSETCAHIEKLVDELNEGMMAVRMLPIGTLFSKFPRLVRDVARATGKAVDLVTEGEDTEIDRSVIEKIKDPLVHMLRNAVDHGIETPEEREATGKPTPARVELSAHHEQGQIIITLKDDGKGIDPKAMRENAVKKGMITADVAKRLSDSEAIDLIFEPGFSTAVKTTGVSGRGVGMDVVQSGVAAVNGLVKVRSEVGAGTTFTLQLPLTLATFRGLLVESGDGVYAFLMSYVQETGRLDPAAVESIVDAEVLRLRDDVLPLLRLGDVCNPSSKNGHGEQEGFVVIVKAGDKPVAVVVDALKEQQEIVVKSLGDYIGKTDGIAGASILGDGQVVLILDVASLVKGATQSGRGAAGQERRAS